jgi:cob(I)alamin adenosyltransferase
MSRIYTRTGDRGETGLFGGGRIPKSDPRVRAYGEVDELNAVLGWTITQLGESDVGARLTAVQRDLFALGAHLATPSGARTRAHLPPLPVDRPAEFEAWMDDLDAELGSLSGFILPGGSGAAAALHVARTVCRRAERGVVELAAAETVEPAILMYLNRLSDLLFELARLANRRAGVADTPWHPDP